MSDYENDNFQREDQNDANFNEKKHKMKISIDFLSVQDLKTPLNIQIQYSLRLSTQSHTFKSARPSAAGLNTEVKLQHSFAAYEFLAGKSELQHILNNTQLKAKILHKESTASTNEIEVGEVEVFLKELLQAPMR